MFLHGLGQLEVEAGAPDPGGVGFGPPEPGGVPAAGVRWRGAEAGGEARRGCVRPCVLASGGATAPRASGSSVPTK